MQPVFGVMQGRLSPPEEGRFQSFPRLSWSAEIAGLEKPGSVTSSGSTTSMGPPRTPFPLQMALRKERAQGAV